MKTPLILVGGGGHCKAVIDVIESTNEYVIHGIIDNNLSGNVFGYPILGSDDLLPQLINDVQHAFVTIGQIKTPQIRVNLYNLLLELGYNIPIIVANSANVSRNATLSDGVIIMHGATVVAGAKIGANVIINNHALVDHDCTIGSDCHISTGAQLNGNVRVGDGCFVGSGAIIREGVHIGSNNFIAMGTLVVKNIE